MTSMSIPTTIAPTPPVSASADVFDFAKRDASSPRSELGGGGDGHRLVASHPSAFHRIFTEEDDIWHEIMLYAWIYDTLRLRQVSSLPQ